AKALIISTCLMVGSMAGVYADTTNVEVKPAIVQEVYDDSKMMETQILMTKSDDALANKQLEIDRYVFADHIEEIEKLGITVTSTAVVGDVVEVAIKPYDVKSADRLYELFGKEMVSVVAGEQAVPLDLVTITSDNPAVSDLAAQSGEVQEASFFETIFNNIVEWFKNIF
ncbi:MAG: hypothetical protein K0S75_2960, partial [Clostridia bacterium]|nr:hypothetical protein [Clostridia bacterium]